jgi:hypothetical protein
MPSTYTTNLGIEKVATGEQSGTWGTTTNTNFDIIDQAVNGIEAITLSSAGASGSPTAIPITDGAASTGRNKFIQFVDGGDLSATAYVQLTPNNAEKIVFIRNSLTNNRSLIIFQGTYSASNDFEIPNGKDVVLKFSGTGTGSTVTQVFNDLLSSALSTTTVTATTGNITTVNATTVDATNVEATNLKAKDGTAAIVVANSSGQVTIANAVLTTADINGGNIDGTALGASTPSTANISTLSLGGVQVTSNAGEINLLDGSGAGTIVNSKGVVYGSSGEVNATTVDSTNIEVTNIKAKDGTAAGSIANSTGVVTLGSSVLTTTDINGGTVDGVTIGTNAVVTDLRVDNLKLDANKVESTSGNLQVAASGAGYLEIRGNNNSGRLRFNCESNSHGVTLSGPPHSASATYGLELPNADGSSGQALVTDGSGKLSFASAGISTGKAIAMAIVFG